MAPRGKKLSKVSGKSGRKRQRDSNDEDVSDEEFVLQSDPESDEDFVEEIAPKGKKRQRPSSAIKRKSVKKEESEKKPRKRKTKGSNIEYDFSTKKAKKDKKIKSAQPPRKGSPKGSQKGRKRPAGQAYPNEDICKVLYAVGKLEKEAGQVYKSVAYFKAANALKAHDVRVSSGKEAQKLKGIGKGIAAAIDEILETGTTATLQELGDNPRVQCMADLERVHGIGPTFAGKLHDEHGVKSVGQLRSNKHLLTEEQKIGLKYVDEFEKDVSREEMDQMKAIVFEEMDKLDKKLEALTCGAYRRGLKQGKDLDILITHPDFVDEKAGKKGRKPKPPTDWLHQLVERLQQRGFVSDVLALGPTKFEGVCILPDEDAGVRQPKTEKGNKEVPKDGKTSTGFSVPSLDELEEDLNQESTTMQQQMHHLPPTGARKNQPKSIATHDDTVPEDEVGVLTPRSITRHLHRRLDMRLVPYNSYWCAVFYYTGPQEFVIQMRREALEQDLQLTDYSLRPVDEKEEKGTNVNVLKVGDALPILKEEDIFDHIGRKYIPPHER